MENICHLNSGPNRDRTSACLWPDRIASLDVGSIQTQIIISQTSLLYLLLLYREMKQVNESLLFYFDKQDTVGYLNIS